MENKCEYPVDIRNCKTCANPGQCSDCPPSEMNEVVELKLCPPIIIPKDVGEEGFIIRSISIDPNNSPELIKWAYNYMCESVLPCKGEPEPGECNECRKRGENISCISLIAKILGLNIFPKKEVKK